MCVNPYWLRSERMFVACGKCLECKMKKSNEWGFRLAHEASLHEKNCVVTLTYNDDFLPADLSVRKTETQNFMKRLRKSIYPHKVRFFACGEYGAKKGRPHYHVVLFGYCPDDLTYLYTTEKGEVLYKSESLAKVWGKGFVSVGLDVTVNTAKYLSKYLQKNIGKPKSENEKQPPFVLMSNRPGIGADAVRDSWLVSGKTYLDGKYISLPKYYKEIILRRHSNDCSDEWTTVLLDYYGNLAEKKRKMRHDALFGITDMETLIRSQNKYKLFSSVFGEEYVSSYEFRHIPKFLTKSLDKY